MTDERLQSLRLHERLLFERIRRMQSERAQIIKQLRRSIRDSKRLTGGRDESDTT